MKKIFIVLILIVSASFISSNPPSKTINVTSKLNIEPDNFINLLIDKLEQGAIYYGDKFIGWPLRENGSSEKDERVYRGFQVGLAGIGDFLLDAYLDGNTRAENLLLKIVNHFKTTSEKSIVGGIFWGRQADRSTAPWTGMRYGTAGIIKFLARVQQLNLTDGLIPLINDGYKYMKTTQYSDGSWPMTENGRETTGIEYGATGVGQALLETYLNILNSTYLYEAIDVGRYLMNSIEKRDGLDVIEWTPLVERSQYDGSVLTGRGSGMAGIIEFMLNLYNVTKDQIYLAKADTLGKTLLKLDLGGYWPNGSVDYITRVSYRQDGYAGFLVGSSGIADTMLRLYNFTKNEEYLNQSARAEKFVDQMITNKFQVSAGINNLGKLFTGFGMGSTGIAYYQLQLYQRNGNTRNLETAEKILEHLYDIIIQNGMLPVYENKLSKGFSYNLEEGVAGLGKVILFYKSITKGSTVDNYENYYSQAVPVTTFETTIQSSSESESNATPVLSIITVFGILVIIKRGKIKSKI